MERKISNLAEIVRAWPQEDQALFKRVFHVTTTTGHLVVPPCMDEWIERQFGSVDTVSSQCIVKVTNLVTMEGALFNGLRSMRPSGSLAIPMAISQT